MLRLRVAQYPTDAVRAPGKTNQNVLCCFCNAADAVRTCPRPPAFHEAHPRRAAPPPSSKGADHVSRYLMPSTPRTMMKTCIPQNRKNANQMWPLNPVHHRHVTPNKASRAWPPIQVWIPNQPQATIARRIAGTFAPRVPNEARHKTGNDTPYFVPACAFRIMGTSTMVLPSRMVIIACHQFMPASMNPPASV